MRIDHSSVLSGPFPTCDSPWVSRTTWTNGKRRCVELADDELVVPCGLRPVHPAHGVAASIRPNAEQLARVPRAASGRRAVMTSADRVFRNRPHGKRLRPNQQPILDVYRPGRLPKTERKSARHTRLNEREVSPAAWRFGPNQPGRPPPRGVRQGRNRAGRFARRTRFRDRAAHHQSPGAPGRAVHDLQPRRHRLALSRPIAVERKHPLEPAHGHPGPNQAQTAQRTQPDRQHEAPRPQEQPAQHGGHGRQTHARERRSQPPKARIQPGCVLSRQEPLERGRGYHRLPTHGIMIPQANPRESP